MVKLINELSDGEAGFEPITNEDSSSLEIEKPSVDTGQVEPDILIQQESKTDSDTCDNFKVNSNDKSREESSNESTVVTAHSKIMGNIPVLKIKKLPSKLDSIALNLSSIAALKKIESGDSKSSKDDDDSNSKTSFASTKETTKKKKKSAEIEERYVLFLFAIYHKNITLVLMLIDSYIFLLFIF